MAKKNFDFFFFTLYFVFFNQMTYFPKVAFSNILSYCDDTIEREQKKNHKKVMNDLSAIVIDSYLWSNQDNEEDIYLFEENTPIKFCYTDKTNTYDEIGMDWLAVQFHPNDNKVIGFYDYYRGVYIHNTFNY